MTDLPRHPAEADAHPQSPLAPRPPEAEWQAAVQAAVVTGATGLGLIEFDGSERAAFLQGQLSNDVMGLQPGQGQWTTYNSPKGRMLATLFLVHDPAGESHTAILARDIAESTAKRLAMFVLRAKVKIRAAVNGARLLGVGGPDASRAIEKAFCATPGEGQVAAAGGSRIVRWPDGRFVVIAANDSRENLDALAQHATPAGQGVWDWLGVRAGVPMITAATQDRFVAQMANWDALRGIDFRKGCYTGQEIVARMQYLGRLKERLFAFRTDVEAPPPPGTRLYSTAFGDQASGTVVNSAPDPSGGSRFLAVCQMLAADGGTIGVGAADGPAATREPLPYALPASSAPRARLPG